jgi:2-C-methyl-D-erythritol 4-phosphate cytidylyltransferase
VGRPDAAGLPARALERRWPRPELLARATDDAWLVERAGGRVRLVESSAANFKVTTPHDLRVAELLLSHPC